MIFRPVPCASQEKMISEMEKVKNEASQLWKSRFCVVLVSLFMCAIICLQVLVGAGQVRYTYS